MFFSVWEYTFAPREYLHQHLETRFSRALAGMVMYSPETSEIAKPSELLASVKAYMNILQTVENYVNIDITRVFNNVLLQQTQQVSYGCLVQFPDSFSAPSHFSFLHPSFRPPSPLPPPCTAFSAYNALVMIIARF